VAAVVVLTSLGKTAGKGGKQWSGMDMRRALKEKLANYKIPQELKVVESIPRNAMGKSRSCKLPLFPDANHTIVNKKTLVKDIFG
jgi:acyl-CoA synthetase (AMP-forming)/AMP-acid ligase II